MGPLVKNIDSLLGKPPDTRREALVSAVEQGILAVQPTVLLKKSLRLEDPYTLVVDGWCVDLVRYPRIIVMATGKAAGLMAQVSEEILGSLIGAGYAIVPPGVKENIRTNIIEIHESTHPQPSEIGVECSKGLVELMKTADDRTLALVLISGGASAMTPLPPDRIPLADKIAVNKMLLGAGADIYEINTVRKHLSMIKGGRLAGYANGALVISLNISDVTGDNISAIGSGITAPDNTTYREARWILEEYGIWARAPESVREWISDGIAGKVAETPKTGDAIFKNVYNRVIGRNEMACDAVVESLVAKYPDREIYNFGSEIVGDVNDVAQRMFEKLMELQATGRKWVVVGGGEPTVVLSENPGRGGRNQQLALILINKLEGNENVSGVCIGTDGIDGNSDAAGAVVDANAFKKIGRDLAQRHIDLNDSNTILENVGAAIKTGPSNTNVYDIFAFLLN